MKWLPLLLIITICSLLSPLTPSTSDGVNFYLALQDFDLDRFQPHFPGYPLYIFFGKLLMLLGLSASWALLMINALSAALLFVIVQKMTTISSWKLLLPFLCIPLLFSKGLIFGSDMMGLAVWSVMIYLLYKKEYHFKTILLISVIAGLLMGIRLGYAPLLSALLFIPLYHKTQRLKTMVILVMGFGLGLVLWLAPLTSLIGFDHYITIGKAFITGHFTTWGGSAITDHSPALRVEKILTIITSQAIIVVPVAFSLYYVITKEKLQWNFWLIALGPYLLFVLFGQNVDNARHFLPLVLPLCLLLTYLEKQLSPPLALTILLITALCNLVWQKNNHHQVAPSLQIISYLKEQKDIENANIYAGESYRFIEWKEPYWNVKEEIYFEELPVDFLNPHPAYFISQQNLEEKFPGQVKALHYFPANKRAIGVFKQQ